MHTDTHSYTQTQHTQEAVSRCDLQLVEYLHSKGGEIHASRKGLIVNDLLEAAGTCLARI
jgi:hypothetical protein